VTSYGGAITARRGHYVCHEGIGPEGKQLRVAYALRPKRSAEAKTAKGRDETRPAPNVDDAAVRETARALGTTVEQLQVEDKVAQCARERREEMKRKAAGKRDELLNAVSPTGRRALERALRRATGTAEEFTNRRDTLVLPRRRATRTSPHCAMKVRRPW